MKFLLSTGILFFLLSSRGDVAALVNRAERAYAEGRWEEARNTLARAAEIGRGTEDGNSALERLGEINLELLLSPWEQPEAVWVQVQPGDSIAKIAKRAGTTVELLLTMNRLSDRGTIRLGRRLKVPIERFSVKIDIRDQTAVLSLGGRFFKQYPVSTGAGGNTPVGTFEITDRLVHPDWWHPLEKRMIPYGDPEHRIGTHWLGWNRKGFGMHGTDEPDRIGQPVSLGCVRFRNEDIAELFMLLPSGTSVTVSP